MSLLCISKFFSKFLSTHLNHNTSMNTAVTRNQHLVQSTLIGAIIGFTVIFFIVVSVDHPRPEWGTYWWIRPILVVPFAGACGGLAFHILGYFRQQGGWKMVGANVLSVLIFIIGMWMGIVLGLNGTMWH
jgi:hypothetical protein